MQAIACHHGPVKNEGSIESFGLCLEPSVSKLPFLFCGASDARRIISMPTTMSSGSGRTHFKCFSCKSNAFKHIGHRYKEDRRPVYSPLKGCIGEAGLTAASSLSTHEQQHHAIPEIYSRTQATKAGKPTARILGTTTTGPACRHAEGISTAGEQPEDLL